jgi:hypothetical protein
VLLKRYKECVCDPDPLYPLPFSFDADESAAKEKNFQNPHIFICKLGRKLGICHGI